MNKSSVRVSIGMPVFNGEIYLEEALESVVTQTYSDFELIISDNGSMDKTPDICQEFASKDKRIQYYRNDENLGAARNYNRVFELAAGEYFRWAAHDDLLAPECLERCVEVLDQESETIMSYPKTILIDEDGKVIEYHYDGFDLRSPKPHKRFRQFFHSSAWCHPVFGLIRANILKKTGLIGNFGSSDKVLLAELAILGKCFEVPEYLAYRRLHPQISTKVFASDEARAEWFDPSRKGVLITPRWRRFVEYSRAIERAQLGWTDRVRCYVEMIKFYLAVGRLVGVVSEFKQLAKGATKFVQHRGQPN